MKILIVDDSTAQRIILKKIFKEKGYSDADIHQAGDGNDALEKASQHDYELILMDLNMPKMDGLTCIKSMRKQNIKTPVVMVTSEGDQEKVNEAMKAGISYFITKPFLPEKLWSIVNSVLK
ncbi:MAG: response regulator [Leptospiraceae bacterium]|nr:response regulator [Leptospiraceae bacterium]MCP5493669.1 response regulator [Leptospiraceae bacterium]